MQQTLQHIYRPLQEFPTPTRKIHAGTRAKFVRAPVATPTRARRAALQVVRTSKFEASNEFAEELRDTAKYIARRGRGILASDESNATTGKRLATVGVENTEDNRRAWRECLYTAPGLGQYISGAVPDSLSFVFVVDGQSHLCG